MNTSVIFVLDEFLGPVNGTEAQFWLLYQALVQQAGRPYKIVTLRPSAYLKAHIPADAYETLNIQYLATIRACLKAFLFALRSRLAGTRVAHLYLNDVSILLPFFLWVCGIRVIVSRRDLGFWYSAKMQKILQFNRRFVARVIANCTAVKEAVVSRERYAPARVTVLLNGVNPPASIKAQGYRQRFGVPAKALVLGMVANLRPLKRVEDAIEALARMKDRGVDAWLLVAGENRIEAGVNQQDVLTHQAHARGVSDRVCFVGMIQPSWGFLAEIDIFLSCSDTEGLSNSIIEAMICTKPVIATSVGGTPELVFNDTTGFMYTPRDVAALTEYLLHLAQDPSSRIRLGAGGAKFAKTMSTSAMRTAHLQLYRQLGASVQLS